MPLTEDGFTHVVMVDTSYYTNSLAQVRRPEGSLRAGTRVRIIEQAGGHVQVETENGIRGHVPSDVLACNATLTACSRAVLP